MEGNGNVEQTDLFSVVRWREWFVWIAKELSKNEHDQQTLIPARNQISLLSHGLKFILSILHWNTPRALSV